MSRGFYSFSTVPLRESFSANVSTIYVGAEFFKIIILLSLSLSIFVFFGLISDFYQISCFLLYVDNDWFVSFGDVSCFIKKDNKMLKFLLNKEVYCAYRINNFILNKNIRYRQKLLNVIYFAINYLNLLYFNCLYQ